MKCKFCKTVVVPTVVGKSKILLEPVDYKIFRINPETKRSVEILEPLYRDHKTLCKGIESDKNQDELWTESYTLSKIVETFDGKI